MIRHIRNGRILENHPDFTKHIPIVVYTQYSDDPDVSRAIVAGGNLILYKDDDNLAYIINSQIENFDKLCQYILPKTETKPKIFIGSSSSENGLKIANAIQGCFNQGGNFDAHVWTSEFEGNEITLESIEKILENFQYSIFVFSPDDSSFDRQGVLCKAPRDNVIFEYGLFCGKYSRKKTFWVVPQNYEQLNMKILSDLKGFNPFPYTDSPNSQTAVSHACTKIMEKINVQNS